MLEMLWLIPALPLAGFLAQMVGRRMPRWLSAGIGVGSVGLSAVLTGVVLAGFVAHPPPGHQYVQVLWDWLTVNGVSVQIALRLDGLSVIMVGVITSVGFLIHLYSAEFMEREEGYGRFFAYMNLFVASMLILVLADNLLLLYLGWEGVGLCSYLLIGFWYKDRANGRAAMKAFIVTRVGDAALAIGLLLLLTTLGTLDIQELMHRAQGQWTPGSAVPVAASLLLLGGAVGKSAQLPLQTWLPDAMAGPTPVSALIHAATMVTAGVYLIARTNALFTLAPNVQALVAIIGAATLLLSGASACVQRDIKRVLAYSTISQIGYMFLGLGVGAWSAALFHFMTHAFFKALLFLAAGVVILTLHHEHDMFRMGGLWRRLPVTFWTFLVGALSLAAIPPITGAFFSKDMILEEAYRSGGAFAALWVAGLLGVILTAAYTTRMVLLTFFGPATQTPAHRTGWALNLPLVILAAASLGVGVLEIAADGHDPYFIPLLQRTLPAEHAPALPSQTTWMLWGTSQAASLAGIIVAWLVVRGNVPSRAIQAGAAAALRRLWFAGWGFDWLYDRLFVRPFIRLTRANRADVVDLPYRAIGWLAEVSHRLLITMQTGQVRWYAAVLAAGAAALVAMTVWL